MKKNIPMELLKDRTSIGLQLQQFKKSNWQPFEEDELGAHRDDHYIFFILEEASTSIMVDFNTVPLSGPVLYYVLPTQVHQRIHAEGVEGWFIAVDPALIPRECRNVFEGQLFLQEPFALNDIQLSQCNNLMQLFYQKYKEDSNDQFYVTVLHALLQTFLAIAAGCYNQIALTDSRFSRPAQLTSQFKNLLIKELREVKRPAVYASMLNVSETYLSEAVKKSTGFPVSYWIQQEVMMEAKRLLYYSQFTVKEVAHNLGYTDHSYFSRLFHKVTGTSAIAFREEYRK